MPSSARLSGLLLAAAIAALGAVVSCSNGPSAGSPAAASSMSTDPILASPTSSSDYLGVTWNEDGIVWHVAEPDSPRWQQSVPEPNLTPTQARSCGVVVVEHLNGYEPGIPAVPAGVSHDQAVSLAAKWCSRIGPTTNLWKVAQAALREMGVEVPNG